MSPAGTAGVTRNLLNKKLLLYMHIHIHIYAGVYTRKKMSLMRISDAYSIKFLDKNNFYIDSVSRRNQL